MFSTVRICSRLFGLAERTYERTYKGPRLTWVGELLPVT